MATIIREGCVVDCSHCNTRFSFIPSEVGVSFTPVPAGYSPEEEAYDKPSLHVQCPKCKSSTNVDSALGPEGKREAVERAKDRNNREDHDV